MLVSSTLLYSSSSCALRAGRPRLDASGGDTFARGVDLLQLSKDKRVTARQVVNVLGRWQEYSDWNEGIGTKGKLDEYRSGDYYEDDVKALKTDFTQPIEYYISRRPQFINFCERYGLVARWVHNENVGQLPFTDEALAASIGATVEELNQEAVDPLAAQVVFDALAGSQAGFVSEQECARRRESFVTSDGGFDAAAFRGALSDTRRNLAGVYAFGPVLFFVLPAALVTWHWLPTLLENFDTFSSKVSQSYAEEGPVVLAFPALALALFASGIKTGDDASGGARSTAIRPPIELAGGDGGSWTRQEGQAGGRPLEWKEKAIQEQDEVRRMRGGTHAQTSNGPCAAVVAAAAAASSASSAPVLHGSRL